MSKLFPIIELLILLIIFLVFNYFQYSLDFLGAKEDETNPFIIVLFANLLLVILIGFIFTLMRTLFIFINPSRFNQLVKKIRLSSLILFLIQSSIFILFIFLIDKYERNPIMLEIDNWSIIKRKIVFAIFFSIPVILYLVSIFIDLFAKPLIASKVETMEHLIDY